MKWLLKTDMLTNMCPNDRVFLPACAKRHHLSVAVHPTGREEGKVISSSGKLQSGVSTENTEMSGVVMGEKCLTEDSKRADTEEKEEHVCSTGETPALHELEEILYSAPRSCHHVDEVWPSLFLGDMFMSHDKFGLWQLGITHVLNATHGKLCCKGSDDFYGTTVKYYGVPANDLPTFDLSPFFHPAAEFIHLALSSGGKIFVHCAVGVSRSAALVLAYLMIHHGFSLRSSIRCVQQKRWIFPNRGFLRQLVDLEQALMSKDKMR